MARLLLVRHAPTPETGSKLTGRAPGVSLHAAGMEVAQHAASRLTKAKVAAIYTSPIARTAETAAVIGEAVGRTPRTHEGLVEIDFGTWTGRTLAQLRRTKLWATVQSNPSRARFPSGESFSEAQLRAVAACESIAEAHKRTTAVLVSHADVIKLVLSFYLGQSLDHFQRIGITPGSISALRVGADHLPVVEAVNTTDGML